MRHPYLAMRIDRIPGLTVDLVSNGVSLPELQCSSDTSQAASHIMSGYVEAIALHVAFEAARPLAGQTVVTYLDLDGRRTGSHWCKVSVDHPMHSRRLGVIRSSDGKRLLQRFCFKKLETSECSLVCSGVETEQIFQATATSLNSPRRPSSAWARCW